MGTNSGPFSAIDGLIYCLDPANPRSYPGTGTGVTELSRVSANPTLNSGVGYFANPKGYFEFDGVNDNIPFTLTNYTTITTVEIWMKMKAFVEGMPFGFNTYDIYTGYSAMGFNTGAGDSYGLTPAQIASLGLLNQWKHYVFEMRSDVSYTNNKIYINGQSQTLSQNGGNENASNRNFNGGLGKISGWLAGGYHQAMDVALFRVYNRALSSGEVLQNYNALNKRFNYLENVVTDGLVFHYDAGKPSGYPGIGNTAYDLSGVGNNAVLTNGPSYSSLNGGSVVFDGTNDYLEATHSSSLNLSGSITVDVWVYLTSLSNSNDMCLIAKYSNTGGGVNQAWILFKSTQSYTGSSPNGTGAINEFVWLASSAGSVTGTFVGTGEQVQVNTWYNVVALYNSSNEKIEIYTNGQLKSSTTRTGQTSGVLATNARNLSIGATPVDGARYLQGRIPIARVYGRALSSTEILQNYNAFKGRYGLS